MRSNLLATLSAIAIAVATTQFAAAAERHHRKPARAPAATTEQLRNANAAWTVPLAQPDIYRYSGGWSAPAGH
jgi:hypothetical protein